VKSTIKIDLESQNSGSTPVIKIIQPVDVLDENSSDFDIRDKLIRDFLHQPSMVERNSLFELATFYPHPMDEPRVNITTIAPVKEENVLYKIRHMVLNRLVPYDTIVELNSCGQVAVKNKKKGQSPMPLRGDLYFKIHEFFDWVDKEGYCSWEDQHPYYVDGKPIAHEKNVLKIRDVFETHLSSEERIAAFENTPKYKWDLRVNSAYQGIDEAFDWTSSPQGWDYWEKVAEKLK